MTAKKHTLRPMMFNVIVRKESYPSWYGWSTVRKTTHQGLQGCRQSVVSDLRLNPVTGVVLDTALLCIGNAETNVRSASRLWRAKTSRFGPYTRGNSRGDHYLCKEVLKTRESSPVIRWSQLVVTSNLGHLIKVKDAFLVHIPLIKG